MNLFGKFHFYNPFEIDLRSLALFRMVIGLIVLSDYLVRFQNFSAFYTNEGVLPSQLLTDRIWILKLNWSLYFLTDSSAFSLLLFFAGIIFALFLLLGFKTRWVTLISWLLLISLHNRNPYILNSGDKLLHLFLFWSVFLPLGAKFSLDEKWNKKNYANEYFSFSTVALILQFFCVYFFSALLKDISVWVSEGTAMYYALNFDRLVNPSFKFLVDYPGLLEFISRFIFLLELIGPLALLFLRRIKFVKMLVVAAFILFHLAALFVFELGIFSYVCLAGWLLFIPSGFWNKIDSRSNFFVISIRKFKSLEYASLTLIIYVLCWNVRSLDFKRFEKIFPIRANIVAQVFQIQQRWGMFAPVPSSEDGWMIIVGKTINDEKINLLSDQKEIAWNKPFEPSSEYQSKRWKSYFYNAYSLHDEKLLKNLAVYFCRKYAELENVNVFFIRELTAGSGEKNIPREKILLKSCECK
ncbi:MAG: HTTM domain-containing protein [Cytophagaceae bacterium]|nr:HTTM domain-containing protein [Cytophagaceae bacterium]